MSQRKFVPLPADSEEQMEEARKEIILLRGPSGSGKSTLARKFQSEFSRQKLRIALHSADDFFMKNGQYCWDPKKLSLAHSNCRERVRRSMENELDRILVDNTNMKIIEMVPYAKLALEFKYFIRIEEVALPKGFQNWHAMIPILEERNAHNVNEDILKRQIGNFEKCTISMLIKAARSPNQQSRGSRSPLPPNNNNNDPSTSTPSTTGLFGKNYEKLVLYCETKRIRLEIESKENNVTMLKLSYPKLKPIFERLFKGNSVENAANNALQQIQ